MDIVTLGAALNGSAEYVNSHFKGGSNIQIVNNPDGTQTINASGEVSSEDTVARAEIAEMKDGTNIDSFGDVETALDDKADTSTTYTKSEVDTALGGKVDKETGKGLSTNDYTTAEKTKLAIIAEGAEVNEIEGIKVNNTSVNPDANKVVNITVPTSAADVSALPDTTKYAAALSLTINSSTYVMTGQLKDQNGDNLGTAQTIDLPLESVVVGGSYNSQTQKVVLALQNGNTVEFSVADLVSGLQTELSASNKLNPAYINYDSTHRAVSDAEKSAWNGKQSALTTEQLAAVNSGITEDDVAQIETNKNNISYNTNQGVKNLFNNVATTSSGNRVSYTPNADKSGTIITESTGAAAPVYFDLGSVTLPSGSYILSGGVSADVSLCDSNNTYVDEGNGATIMLSQSATISLRIRVATGYTNTNGVTVYPMIRSAIISDTTYQPYALSNAELTDNTLIEEITSGITVASGYTKSSTTHVYKQGKHIFGTLVFEKSSGSYPTTGGDIVGTMGNYAPVAQWLGCGFFSDSVWTLKTCGYAFIQNAYGQGDAGQIIVTDGAGGTNKIVKIQIDYVMP